MIKKGRTFIYYSNLKVQEWQFTKIKSTPPRSDGERHSAQHAEQKNLPVTPPSDASNSWNTKKNDYLKRNKSHLNKKHTKN